MDSELRDIFAAKGIKGISENQPTSDFAKKGSANAGLTLGIIGTALAAFAPGILSGNGGGGLLGGLYGGRGAAANGLETVALLSLMNNGGYGPHKGHDSHYSNSQLLELTYQNRIDGLKEAYSMDKGIQAQIYLLSDKINKVEAILPYINEVNDLKGKARFDYAINYADKLDCRNIKGILGIPSTPTVTVFQGANNCGMIPDPAV